MNHGYCKEDIAKWYAKHKQPNLFDYEPNK